MPRSTKTVVPLPGTPAARRHRRPLVLVQGLNYEELFPAVLETGRELGWELVDLDALRGAIPAHPAPSGALLASPQHAVCHQLREAGCPLVEVVPVSEPWPVSWPLVGMDLSAHGRMAAEHFLERGFRNIAYVGHEPLAHAHLVYEGFRDRARELGVECDLFQLRSPDHDESISRAALLRQRERQVGDWLRHHPRPVGLFTYNDKRANMLCAAARKAGLGVPDEVAILGRGNVPYTCEVAPVALSSIDVNHREMGRRAVQLLQRLMQGAPEPEEAVLVAPAGIVVRQSTDVLAAPDPHVAAALRYIWDHLDLDLSVDDIAAEVGVPRHRLERAFRKHLDRGVNEELRRKRLEVFREMLSTTDIPISELAPTVGFRTMVHLQRSFRRAYGMSPRQWRASHAG